MESRGKYNGYDVWPSVSLHIKRVSIGTWAT